MLRGVEILALAGVAPLGPVFLERTSLILWIDAARAHAELGEDAVGGSPEGFPNRGSATWEVSVRPALAAMDFAPKPLVNFLCNDFAPLW